MIDLGDRREGDSWSFGFSTYGQTGSPKWADPSPAASPVVELYKGTGENESSVGLTLAQHDDREGLYRINVVMADAWFAPNLDYFIVFTAGTVDNVTLNGVCIATFSIANRLMQPFPGIDGAVGPARSDTMFDATVPLAALDFYQHQALLWTSGAMKGLTTFITGSSTGEVGPSPPAEPVELTVQTMPATPAYEDTFIILGTKGS